MPHARTRADSKRLNIFRLKRFRIAACHQYLVKVNRLAKMAKAYYRHHRESRQPPHRSRVSWCLRLFGQNQPHGMKHGHASPHDF